MSRKALGDGPGKTTAVTSRGSRMAGILGVLSAMVRGGYVERKPDLTRGVAVPQGVRAGASRELSVPGNDSYLVR